MINTLFNRAFGGIEKVNKDWLICDWEEHQAVLKDDPNVLSMIKLKLFRRRHFSRLIYRDKHDEEFVGTNFDYFNLNKIKE